MSSVVVGSDHIWIIFLKQFTSMMVRLTALRLMVALRVATAWE